MIVEISVFCCQQGIDQGFGSLIQLDENPILLEGRVKTANLYRLQTQQRKLFVGFHILDGLDAAARKYNPHIMGGLGFVPKLEGSGIEGDLAT